MTLMFLALMLAPDMPADRKTMLAQEAPAPSAPAEPGGDRATAAAGEEEICRSRPLQRQGLITQARRVCRTRAEWKAAAARSN